MELKYRCPSPLTRDVGLSMEGKEEPEGGPKKWKAQAVRFLLPRFSTPLTTSQPNAKNNAPNNNENGQATT